MSELIDERRLSFRGKRLNELTRQELLDALRQALARVAELEGRQFVRDEREWQITGSS